MRLDRRRILLALALALSGCSSASAEEAEAPPSKPPPPPVERSYIDQDAALSADQRADILALCSDLVACQRRGVTPDQECKLTMQPRSYWGKMIVSHGSSEPLGTMGRRTARLLQAEDMKWASPDCREVVKRFSARYQ